MKALKGTNDTITYEDADAMSDQLMTDFLYDLREVVQEATDDDEEQANTLVNLSAKLSKLMSAVELKGLLCDPDIYIETLKDELPSALQDMRDRVVIELVEVDVDG